jgi:hypothetical protein
MEYKIDDDSEAELTDRQKLGRLWRAHMYAMQKKKDFAEQLKIYGLWIGSAAGAAGLISTIMGMWPWKK